VFGLLPLGNGTCNDSLISQRAQLVKDESFCNVCRQVADTMKGLSKRKRGERNLGWWRT
jgi:hypothetical protein